MSGKRISPEDTTEDPSSTIDLKKNNFLYGEFFKKYIGQIKGPKVLISSSLVSGRLNLLLPFSCFQSHKIQTPISVLETMSMKLFNSDVKNFIFIINDGLTLALERTCQTINMYFEKAVKYIEKIELKEFFIFLIPGVSKRCREFITESCAKALSKDVNIHVVKLPIDLYGLEKDLVSIENTKVFSSAMIENDYTHISSLTSSLLKFQLINGIIPSITALGRLSCVLANMLVKETKTKLIHYQKLKIPTVNRIIFMDRNVDYLSVFLSQLSYEGLLDELYGIDNNLFKFVTKKKVEVLYLSSDKDAVFGRIRDFGQNFVAHEIKEISNEIKKEQSEINNVSDTMSEMEILKNKYLFAKHKLPKIKIIEKKLNVHLDLMKKIKGMITKIFYRKCIEMQQIIIQKKRNDNKVIFEFINQIVFTKKPLYEALKLLCLFSFVNNGLHTKDYNKFKDSILLTYGFECLIILKRLEKAGLFYHKNSTEINVYVTKKKGFEIDNDVNEDDFDILTRFNSFKSVFNGELWTDVLNQFGLIAENAKNLDKYDDHHSFAGIAPLSFRVLKHILMTDPILEIGKKKHKKKKIDHAKTKSRFLLGRNKGDNVKEEEKWRFLLKEFPKFDHKYKELKEVFFKVHKRKVIMLFFVGGVTMAECNCIRNFNKTSKLFFIVIGTTKMITGRSFLNQFFVGRHKEI